MNVVGLQNVNAVMRTIRSTITATKYAAITAAHNNLSFISVRDVVQLNWLPSAHTPLSAVSAAATSCLFWVMRITGSNPTEINLRLYEEVSPSRMVVADTTSARASTASASLAAAPAQSNCSRHRSLSALALGIDRKWSNDRG